MISDMYKIIQKQNGHEFAKAIRNHHSGIFEIPNIDKIVKYAGNDAKPVLDYLSALLLNNKKQERLEYIDPFILLKIAGYNAYIANTYEKQNAIKQYFIYDEELCTFSDKTRYQKYHIINCIKENAEKLKRKDFKIPKREDEYGASVLSIQIRKCGGFIKILNRYNHGVNYPDNTFNSNPDNIIKGLSHSLSKHFNVDFSQSTDNLPDKYTLFGNMIIKYNYEINDIYFGGNFFISDDEITSLNNDEIMLDQFILNWKTKKIYNPSNDNDGFHQALEEEIKGKKLRVVPKENGIKYLYANNEKIIETKNGEIMSIHFKDVTKINEFFLSANINAKSVILDNVKTIQDEFMYTNLYLQEFKAGKVEVIGDNFLSDNYKISRLIAPMLNEAGANFLFSNITLKHLSLPSLEYAEGYFLYHNELLNYLEAPNLKSTGIGFCSNNKELTELHLPKLHHISEYFLTQNKKMEKISLDMLARKYLKGVLEKHPKRRILLNYSLHRPSIIQKFINGYNELFRS